jgi:hypothetical protein
MAERTPAEKLGLKAGMTATLLHVPDGLQEHLGVPVGVTLLADPAAADFFLEFAADQAQAEERLTALRPVVGPTTVAWLAYPKGGKAAGRDISRDTIWAFVQTLGMRLVANVAIDGTWSAVRMRPQQ